MSNKAFFHILTCWLFLIPTLSSAQSLTRLEYWFDDGFDSKRAINLSGTDYEVDTEISTTGLDAGMHKLWYRIRRSDGMYSPISCSLFFKPIKSEQSLTRLEYWFDDGFDSKRAINLSGTDYEVDTEISTTGLEDGLHQLWYRVRGSDGTYSPISHTLFYKPIKSLYNIENPEALTVTEQSYWFDNEEPEVITVSNPQHEIVQPTTFDTRRLADGKHTLHMRFGNSAGIWNGPVDVEFTKAKVVAPAINVAATEQTGIVKLSFNAVPNGKTYTVVRKYPSGTIRKVEDISNNDYPADMQSADMPAAGQYTYYIDGRYLDIDGKMQKVRSNEVSVSVTQTASPVGKATINGVLTFNGKRTHYPKVPDYKVFINGVRAQESDFGFSYQDMDQFRITDVPYGTELTISIGHEYYAFKDNVRVVVDENTRNRTYYFDGRSDENILPDNSISDLSTDNIHLTEGGWEVGLSNRSNLTWSGDIILKIISKKAKDGYDNRDNDDDSFWNWLMPKASYEDVPHYTEAAHAHVTIDGKQHKYFTLPITALPETDKNEDYYIYIFSKKDGTGLPKVLQGDLPKVVKFNPFDYAAAFGQGFVSYMKGYAEVMKILKSYAAWGDPLKLAWDSSGEAFNKYIESLDDFQDGSVDIWKLTEDEADVAIRSAGLLLNCFFSDMDKAVKKYVKSIKSSDVYIIHKGISDLYNQIKSAYNAYQADDNHKFFELAKLVLKYSKQLGLENDPVTSVYKSYFEVGEKMASAIEDMNNTITSSLVWDKLAEGKGIYHIKIRRHPIDGKFAGYFPGTDYYQTRGFDDHHDGQIKSIDILLRNPVNGTENRCKPLTMDNLEFTSDGITIKNVKFRNKADAQLNTEAWMTITWNNKRVTRIPLLDEDFVKIQNLHDYSDSTPIIMTVELQSEACYNRENLANKLTFVEP